MSPATWPTSGASGWSEAGHWTGSTAAEPRHVPARAVLSGYAGPYAHPATRRTQSWGARPYLVSDTAARRARVDLQRELLVDPGAIGEDGVWRADVVDPIIECDAEVGRLIRDRDREPLDAEHLDKDCPGRLGRRLAVPDRPQLGSVLVLQPLASAPVSERVPPTMSDGRRTLRQAFPSSMSPARLCRIWSSLDLTTGRSRTRYAFCPRVNHLQTHHRDLNLHLIQSWTSPL